MQPLRLALTGEGSGPDLMKMMELFGADETKSRIESAIASLKRFI